MGPGYHPGINDNLKRRQQFYEREQAFILETAKDYDLDFDTVEEIYNDKYDWLKPMAFYDALDDLKGNK